MTLGANWPGLLMSLISGHVGCYDGQGKHAEKLAALRGPPLSTINLFLPTLVLMIRSNMRALRALDGRWAGWSPGN